MSDRLPFSAIAIGLCLALLMWIMPLRSELAFWRPPFVLLLVTYWLFRQPHYYGVVFAWLVGLAVDLLFGEILGQHALAMSVAAYLVMSQQHRTHHFRILYQSVFVAVVVLAYEVVLLSVRLAVEDIDAVLPVFYSVLSSALVWPLLYTILQKLHREQW
ncbi:MAG: rod shape-determining protein MreD [Cellvibrionales bacterium]|nr:MAG: rod shape-determining protein MreD [Cellvibrionales bacterium]